MDDDEHLLPGPSLRARWRPRNTQAARGTGEHRGFRVRNRSGPPAPLLSLNTQEGRRLASQQRQIPYQNYPQRAENHMRGRFTGRGASPRIENNSNHTKVDGQNRAANKGKFNYYDKKVMGFKRLQDIANSDEKDIISTVNQKREAFLDIIGKDIERHDVFVLSIKILSKICNSSFDQLKFKLILEMCNTQFIGSLLKYLLDLPYAEMKSNNSLYWNNQEEFWSNLVTFCDYIITSSPSTAFMKYRSLVEATKACLNNLNEQNAFAGANKYITKLDELRTKLSTISNKHAAAMSRKDGSDDIHDVQPPDNFRWLNIVPMSVDLSQHTPFVRPNIIKGAYHDIEHYLDVQFRLLREDCFGPLREGVLQFKKDPHRRSYDNIRVFNNVKFTQPYITQGKVGSVVQIELSHRKNKNFAKTNWEYNKRFIFGSLVLFTKDNCRNFIAATVMDRNPRLLAQGKIPVTLVDERFDESLYNPNDSYTMIESEIFFEPYYHVMKAMQDPLFSEKLPMQQYIVKVQSEHNPPSYLRPDQKFVFKVILDANNCGRGETDLVRRIFYDSDSDDDNYDDDNVVKIRPTVDKYDVLRPDTWPSKEEFNLDESQYEAYKHALTHEFAVIQGPPGTGKTFIGLKITKTLLDNLKHINGCLMLVICYTNHALDQFLEGILRYTRSVARVGGQSKNKDLEEMNLNKLRSKISRRSATHDLYIAQKNDVDMSTNEFKNGLILLDILNNGVLSYDCIKDSAPGLQLLGDYYSNFNEPLFTWLFENARHSDADFEDCLLKHEDDMDNMEEVKEETDRRKQKLLVGYDDYDSEKLDEIFKSEELKTSFSLKIAEKNLKDMITDYKNKPQNEEQLRYLMRQIMDLNSQIIMFKTMSELKWHRIDRRIDNRTNFRMIPTEDRWALYFGWVEPKIEEIKNNVAVLQRSLEPKITTLEESRMLLDLEVLKHTRVVGMTTSGAARLRKLINALDAPIVIIEEAAEVLEQHIITSLTKNSQHVILIGDHQQLRPSASHIKLARQFNLEVSLFERMVSNGVHSRRLGVQHRMRPEIAALVSPHIYRDLHNHDSVLTKPHVSGLDKNLFFFTHDYKEEAPTEWSRSKANHKEADFVLALANYIVMQGYKAEDVTILTTYSGQMFYLRKERAKYFQLKHVKITVVDNYQGEESKIILLSLVRNNEKGEIGFLGTENRICVALSRAQEGFYIFGNIDILRNKSPLWEKIATTLENSENIGSSLLLKCERHLNYKTVINTVEDFEKVPEGGCNQQCNLEMKCGHNCLLFCHGYDRPHETEWTKCELPCERTVCDLEHGCPLKCWQECEPCKVLMKKTLPCKHDMDLFCHLDPEDKSIKCLTEVPCTLPACGHKGTKMCYEKLERVRCKEPCIYRLECGHACMRTCHVKNDPDHEKYQCRKRCERSKKGCSVVRDNETDLGKHACGKLCHEACDECSVQVEKKRSNCKHVYKVRCCQDADEIVCQKKCARSLPCGHFCKKKCCDPCGDCTEMVKKPIPECGHELRIMCKDAATRELCTRKCERKLACGHGCKSLCSRICDPNTCTEPSEHQMRAPCDHLVYVPCNLVKPINEGVMAAEVLLEHCTQACGVVLACGHVCRGSCAACFQGRLHVPCQNPCGRPIICGHECTEPCNQVCPPCQRPCEVKCAHSTCSKRCGQPCTPCKEKCTRSCPHGTCERRCDQECEVPPCDQPCDQPLPCGHPCRGLCGEPCPDACKLCRPDSFPRGLIGEEFDDDDKLIQLLDCGHILCVDDADGLMNTDREVIHIRTCPHCRKPIINTNRYKDIVNNSFKTEIGPIKKKIYGHVKDIIEKRDKLLQEFKDANLPDKVKPNSCLNRRYLKLHEVLGQKKQASLLELEMQLIYLNILSLTANCFEKYTKEKSTELKKEVETQIKLICTVLDTKRKKWLAVTKISEQQQTDALKEIKRLNSIIQFSLFVSHESYKTVRQNPDVNKAVKEARAVVFSVQAFDEKKTVETLKKLQQIVKVSGCLSMDEIRMVIKAVKDVPQTGHWFKCPNGHFYAIGECGGAMQTSKCVDCGAAVGGSSHRLLATNAHAREIDGSRFPKWSEQYNNMANFNFDLD